MWCPWNTQHIRARGSELHTAHARVPQLKVNNGEELLRGEALVYWINWGTTLANHLKLTPDILVMAITEVVKNTLIMTISVQKSKSNLCPPSSPYSQTENGLAV